MVYDPKKDRYNTNRTSAATNATKADAVVPSDAVDLTSYAKALLVTVAGTLSLIPAKNADNAPVALAAVVVGQVIPIRTRRVRATGTTATVIALHD
jgi:hypothetical protein